MSDIEQVEQNERTKQPRIRKDGKIDKRSYNKPPNTNVLTARERLSYLLKKGKQAIKDTNVDKKKEQENYKDVDIKKIKKNVDENIQSDYEETDNEIKPKKRTLSNIRKYKSKRPKKIVVQEESEDEDESNYEESESDVPVVVVKKGKGRKKAPPKSNNNDLDVLTKLEKKLSEMEMNYTKKEQERELALQQLKANNDFVNSTRQRMILKF